MGLSVANACLKIKWCRNATAPPGVVTEPYFLSRRLSSSLFLRRSMRKSALSGHVIEQSICRFLGVELVRLKKALWHKVHIASKTLKPLLNG
jgi:hypothetical protein